jgi:osmotically-inducible protein OsmY
MCSLPLPGAVLFSNERSSPVNTMTMTTSAHRWLRALVATVLALAALGCAHDTTLGQKVDDTVITSKVKAALLADPDVSGTAIQVETLRGQVQLSGFVKSPMQARRAVDLARRVDGVNRVLNNITVAAS